MISAYLWRLPLEIFARQSVLLFLSQITISICTSYHIASLTSKININSLTVHQTSKGGAGRDLVLLNFSFV